MAAPRTATRLVPFSIADAITTMRIPLAIIFPLVPSAPVRLTVLALAAATDLGDGWVARRFGASRIGVVLDPIADKLFVATAFAVVWIAGQLTWYETLAVLARDIVASAAFFSALAAGRVAAVPARPGGKAVTMLQMATLVTFVLGWSGMRRLAWATAAVGLYAIYDYHQPFFRKLRAR